MILHRRTGHHGLESPPLATIAERDSTPPIPGFGSYDSQGITLDRLTEARAASLPAFPFFLSVSENGGQDLRLCSQQVTDAPQLSLARSSLVLDD